LKRVPSHYILTFLTILSVLFMLPSCETVDVFEKNVAIPKQTWSSELKPTIDFEIKDTVSRYKIFIVLRHTDAYRYKNIWLNIEVKAPDGTVQNLSPDMQLASDDKGWAGTVMDDIVEQRIPFPPTQEPWPLKKGLYRFRISNIMREDPLEHVMNVGIRIEKAK
jgi:gliding motility-associated lipoprotein GldH